MLNFSIGSSFGSISGIITGLGLILGMYGADLSINSIIISLVSIALSDSISDALGIYYGVEAQNIFRINNSLETKQKQNQNQQNQENNDPIRQAQLTFIAKLVLPLLMIIPFILFESKKNAVISNIVFGTIVIYYVSSKIFKSRTNTYQNIIITWLAILVTYLIGVQLKV